MCVTAASQAADERVRYVPPQMQEWKLLRKVDPEYPSATIQRPIQGRVRFSAVIGKDGHVERLRLMSGHPLLIRAAREAARHWIYRPTLMGGKPVRVITAIDVFFRPDSQRSPTHQARWVARLP